MSDQEIFEILSDNESCLFYACCANKGNEVLEAAHEAAKQALEIYAKATGCHN